MFIDVKTLLKERGEDYELELLTGQGGLEKVITVPDINRPGLALAGFFECFPYECIQVIGLIEHTYLNHLDYDAQVKVLNKIFSNEKAVSCILTDNLEVFDAMIKVFSDLEIPLLRTKLNSSFFIGDLGYYLDCKLAPSVKIHGVMTSVYDLGVLIIGKSAIGKSECALELIRRGHKFVADDIVNIKKLSRHNLMASSLKLTKYLIEVRGIGIIDIKELFGIGNILDEAYVELVIKLEEWDSAKCYERVGLSEYYAEYLGVKVPEATIPIGHVRNLAVLIETASLNQKLKNEGHFTAKKFNDKLREKKY
ncbi:MAG: HPr(Ser) kinase/phosphatase [Endomicrobium sp.]|jgi:HPr kinase/phosphorylase|nr:HPr(Ser) kinase/phosphatase [Endomicrobium sp.]